MSELGAECIGIADEGLGAASALLMLRISTAWCSASELQILCIGAANTLHRHSRSSALVLQMPSICASHSLHWSCSCSVLAAAHALLSADAPSWHCRCSALALSASALPVLHPPHLHWHCSASTMQMLCIGADNACLSTSNAPLNVSNVWHLGSLCSASGLPMVRIGAHLHQCCRCSTSALQMICIGTTNAPHPCCWCSALVLPMICISAANPPHQRCQCNALHWRFLMLRISAANVRLWNLITEQWLERSVSDSM